MARTKKVKEEPKTYRIDRNYKIWTLATEHGLTTKEITENEDPKIYTKSVVNTVLKTLKRYKNKKEVKNYFELAFALKDFCLANGFDPDKYVISLANALYIKEVFSIAQLKKVKIVDFEENILNGKQMNAAGKTAKAILNGYYVSIKKR